MPFNLRRIARRLVPDCDWERESGGVISKGKEKNYWLRACIIQQDPAFKKLLFKNESEPFSCTMRPFKF